MTTKPVLYEYFKSTVDLLLSQYARSKQQHASNNLGKNREHFCEEFLKKVLPPKLSVASGEIWDSEHNKTGQLDIIILRDDAPCLHYGSDNTYLAEGVFAVIEIKSNLTREKLKEAGDSLSKVDHLRINSNVIMSSGPQLKRPLRIVVGYEGAASKTLINEIEQNNWGELFDLICILDRGVLLKSGLLLEWSAQTQFLEIETRAALGFLYYYLISYSNSFLGRSIALDPYFKPFSEWREM